MAGSTIGQALRQRRDAAVPRTDRWHRPDDPAEPAVGRRGAADFPNDPDRPGAPLRRKRRRPTTSRRSTNPRSSRGAGERRGADGGEGVRPATQGVRAGSASADAAAPDSMADATLPSTMWSAPSLLSALLLQPNRARRSACTSRTHRQDFTIGTFVTFESVLYLSIADRRNSSFGLDSGRCCCSPCKSRRTSRRAAPTGHAGDLLRKNDHITFDPRRF